jgi:hypothetical protein
VEAIKNSSGNKKKGAQSKSDLFCLKSRRSAKPETGPDSESAGELGGKGKEDPRREGSVGSLVIAGRAAGLAVHEAVGADADVKRPLAEAAELFALAVVFGFLALRAAVFRTSGSGSHGANVARASSGENVTLVTKNRPQTSDLGHQT